MEVIAFLADLLFHPAVWIAVLLALIAVSCWQVHKADREYEAELEKKLADNAWLKAVKAWEASDWHDSSSLPTLGVDRRTEWRHR